MDRKHKVFISWSKKKGQNAAGMLKKHFESILYGVSVFVSETDIEAGTKWNERLHDELSENDCAIVIITKDSINSAWVNYEIGAIAFNQNKRVIPLLIGVDIKSITSHPIYQYQAKILNIENLEIIMLEIAKMFNDDQNIEEKTKKLFGLEKEDIEKSIALIMSEKQQIKKVDVKDKEFTINEVFLEVRNLASQIDNILNIVIDIDKTNSQINRKQTGLLYNDGYSIFDRDNYVSPTKMNRVYTRDFYELFFHFDNKIKSKDLLESAKRELNDVLSDVVDKSTWALSDMLFNAGSISLSTSKSTFEEIIKQKEFIINRMKKYGLYDISDLPF